VSPATPVLVFVKSVNVPAADPAAIVTTIDSLDEFFLTVKTNDPNADCVLDVTT
jgi:hypothetical protein